MNIKELKNNYLNSIDKARTINDFRLTNEQIIELYNSLEDNDKQELLFFLEPSRLKKIESLLPGIESQDFYDYQKDNLTEKLNTAHTNLEFATDAINEEQQNIEASKLSVEQSEQEIADNKIAIKEISKHIKVLTRKEKIAQKKLERIQAPSKLDRVIVISKIRANLQKQRLTTYNEIREQQELAELELQDKKELTVLEQQNIIAEKENILAAKEAIKQAKRDIIAHTKLVRGIEVKIKKLTRMERKELGYKLYHQKYSTKEAVANVRTAKQTPDNNIDTNRLAKAMSHFFTEMSSIGVNIGKPLTDHITKANMPQTKVATITQEQLDTLINITNSLQEVYNNNQNLERGRSRTLQNSNTGYVNICLLCLGIITLTLITIGSVVTFLGK